MKKFIILSAAIISLVSSGCSYVTDMVEGSITERASFSADASYDGSNVKITWDQAESNSNFMGIEIYRTSEPNDEYSDYIKVADQFSHTTANLDLNTTTQFTYLVSSDTGPNTPLHGVYFYRVGIIYWKHSETDRIAANGYTEPWNLNIGTNYDKGLTKIDSISGYAKVVIP